MDTHLDRLWRADDLLVPEGLAVALFLGGKVLPLLGIGGVRANLLCDRGLANVLHSFLNLTFHTQYSCMLCSMLHVLSNRLQDEAST